MEGNFLINAAYIYIYNILKRIHILRFKLQFTNKDIYTYIQTLKI